MTNRRRVFKVAEKIRELIATELYQLADRRFSLATITSVVVTADLGEAKVYWNVSGDQARITETGEAFEAAAGHFRHLLAKELKMRITPSLRFYYDDTLDTYARVDSLLKRVKDESAA